MKQDDQERPVQYNCVANPLKETVTINLDFIKDMMENWWTNVTVGDAIVKFTEKLRFDEGITSLDSYIKVLESELLFQQTIKELQEINDADSNDGDVDKEAKIAGKKSLPPGVEDIF